MIHRQAMQNNGHEHLDIYHVRSDSVEPTTPIDVLILGEASVSRRCTARPQAQYNAFSIFPGTVVNRRALSVGAIDENHPQNTNLCYTLRPYCRFMGILLRLASTARPPLGP